MLRHIFLEGELNKLHIMYIIRIIYKLFNLVAVPLEQLLDYTVRQKSFTLYLSLYMLMENNYCDKIK